MKFKTNLIFIAVLILFAVITFHAGAQPFVLKKMADLNTPIPNGSGNFSGLWRPLINGGNVVFTGLGTGPKGIYLFNGADLIKVTDLNTSIPNGSGTFTEIYDPMISDDTIAFQAEGVGQKGIYLASLQTKTVTMPILSE